MYDGEWMHGKAHGYGKHVWDSSRPEAGVYEGEWKDGRTHGHGKVICNGHTYECEWREGNALRPIAHSRNMYDLLRKMRLTTPSRDSCNHPPAHQQQEMEEEEAEEQEAGVDIFFSYTHGFYEIAR